MLAAWAISLLVLIAGGCLEAQAGSIWPQPLNQTNSSRVLYLDVNKFHFKSEGFESGILKKAFQRYEDIIFGTPSFQTPSQAANGWEDAAISSKKNAIKHLKVYVASNDQSLNLDTDEGYVLTIGAPGSSIAANTVYGALRGLETFSQLIDRLDHPLDISDDADEDDANTGDSTEWLSQARRLQSSDFSKDEGDETVAEDTPFGPIANTQLARLARLTSGSSDDSLSNLAAELQSIDIEVYGEGAHKRLDDSSSADDEAGDAEEADSQEADDDVSNDGGADNKHHKKKHHKKKHHKHKDRTQYLVNATAIYDAPRFRHRGLLIDTARHFLPVHVILDHLDAMAWSKMNVLHWHIVDDQSFPFVSLELPLLSRYGAFARDLVYSPKDVREVVDYARERGIRVIPEFDTPGHTLSWGAGYPDILADCYDSDGSATGKKGPMNPASNETYTLLWKLLREISSVFPDTYVHLGGDEVPFDCWLNNPGIKAWMADQDPEIQSMPQLEQYFERRVLDLAASAGRSYIIWQEIVDNDVQVQDDTVVHVWKWWWPTTDPALLAAPQEPPQTPATAGSSNSTANGSWSSSRRLLQRSGSGLHEESQARQGPSDDDLHQRRGVCTLQKGCAPPEGVREDVPGWTHEMERVTAKGYRTLLSSPWYLNLGGFASHDWMSYYSVEPLSFPGSREAHALVMGGEACMWGEYVDATNSIQRTWPRAAAVAERLWSDASVKGPEHAEPRLAEHRCRVLARGVSAEPLGPGFCPQDYQ